MLPSGNFWPETRVSDGWSKLCHTIACALVSRTRFPELSSWIECTPLFAVWLLQIADPLCDKTRLPSRPSLRLQICSGRWPTHVHRHKVTISQRITRSITKSAREWTLQVLYLPQFCIWTCLIDAVTSTRGSYPASRVYAVAEIVGHPHLHWRRILEVYGRIALGSSNWSSRNFLQIEPVRIWCGNESSHHLLSVPQRAPCTTQLCSILCSHQLNLFRQQQLRNCKHICHLHQQHADQF